MKPKSLSEAIRDAIAASTLSRYAIAKQSGVPESVLSRFMARERSISLETAEKLTSLFGLTLRPPESQ